MPILEPSPTLQSVDVSGTTTGLAVEATIANVEGANTRLLTNGNQFGPTESASASGSGTVTTRHEVTDFSRLTGSGVRVEIVATANGSRVGSRDITQQVTQVINSKLDDGSGDDPPGNGPAPQPTPEPEPTPDPSPDPGQSPDPDDGGGSPSTSTSLLDELRNALGSLPAPFDQPIVVGGAGVLLLVVMLA
jgi:hypothetical protein